MLEQIGIELSPEVVVDPRGITELKDKVVEERIRSSTTVCFLRRVGLGEPSEVVDDYENMLKATFAQVDLHKVDGH